MPGPPFVSPVAAAPVAALSAVAAAADAQPARPVTDSAGATAAAFVRALERGAWEDAARASALVPPAGVTPEALLRGLWTQLVGQLGALAALDAAPAVQNAESRIVDLGARFARSEVTLRVVVGAGGKVTGFWVTPPRAPAYAAPPYADAARVQEQTLAVGAEPALGATLTAPAGAAAPFPVVVLVHGSGPNDRDERVGANRPFRDLALGLATRGVAVLRYDKRTFAHPRALAGRRVTLEVEVIDDALAALGAARAVPGADPARVFVVGHSLGRRSRRRSPRATAASPARSCSRRRAARSRRRRSSSSTSSPAGPATAGSRRRPYERLRGQLRDLAARRLPPDSVVLGAPAWYWYDLDDRRPLDRAAPRACRCSPCSAAVTTRSPPPTWRPGARRSPGGRGPPSRCDRRSTTCSSRRGPVVARGVPGAPRPRRAGAGGADRTLGAGAAARALIRRRPQRSAGARRFLDRRAPDRPPVRRPPSPNA
jgi:hypothetical protein